MTMKKKTTKSSGKRGKVKDLPAKKPVSPKGGGLTFSNSIATAVATIGNADLRVNATSRNLLK